jgi:tetratricopeptide (TPR) repeat protein
MCYLELGHVCLDPEYYKKAIHFFRLASRIDEENDQIWLDWGICLIYLAQHTIDPDFRDHYYWDAEQKISKSGQFGNPYAYYNISCLYSLLGRTAEAMLFIQKALSAKSLPTLDEMANDEWLDNLRDTKPFTQFFAALEAKLHQVREE